MGVGASSPAQGKASRGKSKERMAMGREWRLREEAGERCRVETEGGQGQVAIKRRV